MTYRSHSELARDGTNDWISRTFKLGLLLALVIAPITSLILSPIILGASKWGPAIITAACVLVFITLNLLKLPDGDFLWYSAHFVYFNDGSLFTVFQEPVAGVQASIAEPLYHAFSFVLSRMTNGEVAFLTIATTGAIYALPIQGILFRCRGTLNYSASRMTFVICAFLFFGITFTLTNHLIRQYLGMSCALSGALLLSGGSRIVGLTMCVAGILIHNVCAVFLVFALFDLVLANQMTKTTRIRLITDGILLTFVAIIFVNITDVSDRLSTDDLLFKVEDGQISNLVRYFDFALWACTLFCIVFLSGRKDNEDKMSMFILYTNIIFLNLLVSFSPFLSLRLYFLIDYVRWVPAIIFANIFPADGIIRVASAAIVAIGLVYVEARIQSSSLVFSWDVSTLTLFVVHLFY